MSDWRIKFYTDPDWHNVIDEFESYIADCENIKSIDTDRPSEAVHADVIARRLVAERLRAFIESTKMTSKLSKKSLRSFK